MTANRVVDVTEHGRHLSLDRGFLVVSSKEAEIGRVPLDDIGAVVLSAYGTSYTTPLVVALAERGAIIVTCGKNHLPIAWTLPVVGHHAQTRITAAQVAAREAFNNRLWQYLMQSKVGAQAVVLEETGRNPVVLEELIQHIHSGDPTNVEGRAAKIYWPALFGYGFQRDREAYGVNSALNYGYTVLRAATARAIVASGLHPSVSIRHRRDPLALADDIMESFRPVIDYKVFILASRGRVQVSRETREDLVELVGSIQTGLLQLVQSIANSYVNEEPPKWRPSCNVGHRFVRLANDNGCAEERGGVLSEESSTPWLRTNAALGIHAEMSWKEGDDIEQSP